MVITLNIVISKVRVLDEVAKTTAYIGSKAMSGEDPGAYDRIAALDADREQLDRYWMEACSEASRLLDHWMVSVSDQTLTHHVELGRDYAATLAMPTNWNSAYSKTIEELLTSFMVDSIAAKWLLITDKQDAAAHAALADGTSKQVSQLLLARVRPQRRSAGGGESGMWASTDTWDSTILWQYN